MLTTLSIISLDQGKIWKDPCPLPREDATAIKSDETPLALEGVSAFSALVALVVRLTTFRNGQKQV